MRILLLLFLCVASPWAIPQQPTSSLLKQRPGRIIGGQPARPEQFKFMVAIFFDTDEGSYFCGGALISPQWILTAAHCTNNATVFTVHLGSTQLESEDPNRVKLATVNSVTHPRYNPDTAENNIGLIKLFVPVELTDHIEPIKLPTVPLNPDTVVEAIGWGETSDWGSGVVNDLNYVILDAISNEECQVSFGDLVKETMVCAIGNFNEGLCQGDTGGPLVMMEGFTYTHVGVGSFISMNGCEEPTPSGFTRTHSYLSWIQDVTGL